MDKFLVARRNMNTIYKSGRACPRRARVFWKWFRVCQKTARKECRRIMRKAGVL